MVDFRAFNLTGGIDLKSSNALIAQSEKLIAWRDAQNVEIVESGGISRMKGNSQICKLSCSILGLSEYIKDNNRYLVVNTGNGTFGVFNGTGIDIKKTSLCTSNKCTYDNFQNGIVVNNGQDDPFFFEINVSPEIKPCNFISQIGVLPGLPMVTHKGRLWIASGGALYYSALGLFDQWTPDLTENGAGNFINFHNSSAKITGLAVYGEYLAIHRENQSYLLAFYGTGNASNSIKPIADRGSVSPFGIINFENKQFFYNSGIYNLSQIGQLLQISLSNEISLLIHPDFSNLDKSKLNQIVAVPYPDKKQIWFYMPYSGQNDLSVCWIYDLFNNCWYKRVQQAINCACLYNYQIYTGTSDGYIFIENAGDSFNGNTEFVSFWNSPFFHFGEPAKFKSIDEFYIQCGITASTSCKISFRYDNDSRYEDIEDLKFDDSDVLVFDDDKTLLDYNDFASDISIPEKINIPNNFRSIQVCFKTYTADENFRIDGFEFLEIDVEE
jgi:hypothetical protein